MIETKLIHEHVCEEGANQPAPSYDGFNGLWRCGYLAGLNYCPHCGEKLKYPMPSELWEAT